MKRITIQDHGFRESENKNFIRKLIFLLILGVFIIQTGYAQHPYGFLDGNVLNDDGKLDWEDVYNNSGLPVGSISTGLVNDRVLPDDIFTGGSTKDHLPISGWLNKLQDGSSSDKSNILQGGAILIDGRIYFFGNRFSNEGSTNIGFWFFQDDINVLEGSFEGEHEIGDILVVAEITNGGAVGKIAAYEWRGSEANGGEVPSSEKSLIKIVDEENPQPELLSAVVNSMPAPTPWPYVGKGEPTPNVMPPISFFEGFINIEGLNLNNACFSSFLIETRSSFSLTSILEDFVGSNFNVEPAVTIEDITDCEDQFPQTLTATVDGGIPPLTFEWKKDGVVIEGELGSSISVSEEGTYSVTVTGSGVGGIGTCTSEADTAEVTFIDAPSLQNASDTFCEDVQSQTTLSDYNGDIGADPADTVVWYSDSDRTMVVTQTGDLAVGDHTFYATVTNSDTCDSDAELTITIDAAPDLENASDTFCEDDQSQTTLSDYNDDIGADPGDTVVWYSDPERTMVVTQTGDLAVGEHTFYATVTNSDTCDSDAELTITIDAAPDLENASDTFCEDDQSQTTLSDYNDDIGADPGDTVVWYSDPERTMVVTQTGDLAVGEHTFYATVTNSDTCDSDAELTITIDAAPDLENASDTFCEDDQSQTTLSDYNDDIGADPGDTVVWYSDPERTMVVTQTGDLAVGEHTFYATVTNSDTCDSDAELTITIDAAPDLENASDTFCEDDQSQTTLSDYNDDIGADPGDTVVWYSDPERTMVVTQTGDLAVGEHTFYATVTNSDTCDSDAELTITIDAAPDLENASDTFCEDDQSQTTLSDYNDDIGADPGDTVVWYSDPERTMVVTQTGDLAVGEHTFYATVTNSDTCDSDAELTITIDAAPDLENASDTFCEDDQSQTTLSDYNDDIGAGPGDTVVWYSDPERTMVVTQTGDLAVGEHTFYATVTNSDTCDSDAELTIYINDTNSLINITDTFCEDDQSQTTLSDYNSDIGAGGSDTVVWYSDPERTMVVTQTGDLAVGDHTFYATVTNSDTCDSDAELTITIDAAPDLQNASDTFCEDDQSQTTLSDYNDDIGAGPADTVVWYSDPERTMVVTQTGDLAVGDHTFYATVTNSDTCDSDAELTITINPNPTFDTQQPPLDCLGGAPSIAVTSDTSGLQFRLVIKGQSGSFADYTGSFEDLEYNTTYVLTARSTTGPTFCETDYEFTTPVPLDIPSVVTLMVNSPTCDSFDGTTYYGSIQITNHVPTYLYAVVDQATFDDIASVPSSAYMNYDSTSGLISGIAVGSYYVIAKSPDGCLSAITPADLIEPQCITCETAFAKDASSSSCFDQYPDLIPNDNRWGWTNYYESAGDYTLDLYAAAGQCDISKGALVGEVNIYDNGDGTIDVQFLADPGYIMSSVHLYVGCEPLPYKKKGKNYEYTVAPGQYPQNPNGNIGYVTDYTIEGIEVSGSFYVIAHVDICTSEDPDLISEIRSESVPVNYTLHKRFSSMQTCINSNGPSKSSTELTQTSLSEPSEPLFSIAPVPFRDVLNIGYLFDYTSDVTIQVFDLNGRLLTTYTDTAVNSDSVSTFSVDFRTKPNQIYIVRMETDREVYTAKIIAAK
ncbi:T9SS type A sorting domain-containing protein [Gramella sp. GC03-9]|uniref:T9SS type A sorting domain-containing protein n=1 Tax=Christiangramia oceanisediminis TaxID=2920386 RepID=A0A9X2RCE9_9FLAO|nr:T9SS type A sorting domain-containing protein [Gramella oceanisediminis]MCP9201609.1 T9SS type A sorting domain-containing protein [Gramella oceanisediminis]